MNIDKNKEITKSENFDENINKISELIKIKNKDVVTNEINNVNNIEQFNEINKNISDNKILIENENKMDTCITISTTIKNGMDTETTRTNVLYVTAEQKIYFKYTSQCL